MKFMHFSDTHLGRADYKLKEREQDYYNVFKQAISIAIEESVDFVIHTGDFFDRGNPSHKSVVCAIRELKRLKEKEIPVFVISGSHDMTLDETVISILEEIGLVKNLARREYYESTENEIIMKGYFHEDVFMCGMAGRQANIQEIFKKLKPNPLFKQAGYRIFMFHHTISDISTQFMDIPTSLLPKGFDYYAAGHWHSAYTANYDSGIIQYVGSTEFNEKKDMESGEKKRVIIVDTKTRMIKHRMLDTRASRVEKIDCEGLSPSEATIKCLEKLESNHGTLLLMELKGRLREGEKNMIDRQAIKEEARSKGYLHCQLYINDLLNPKEKVVKKRNVKDIEGEYLKSKGYSQHEITLAKRILEEMGKALKPEELEAAKKRIVEEIEK